MPSVSLDSALRCLSLLGTALIALKLRRTGLYHRFPFFFFFLIYRVPEGLVALALDLKSPAYVTFWMVVTPITCIFNFLMVTELARLMLASYKGLYSLLKIAMIVSIAIAIVVSSFSLLLRIQEAQGGRPNMAGVLIFAGDRGLQLALAAFIFLILLFLSRYPIVLSRNVRAHSVIFSIYFLANTTGLLMRTLLGMAVAMPVVVMITLTELGAMAAWLLLLSPAGETIPEPKTRLTTEHEQRLLAQLDALNSTLLKTRR